MTSHVELVQAVADAIADRDVPRLIELTDPEVEFRSFFAELQEGGAYQGHAGIEQYVRDLGETLDVFQAHLDQTISVGSQVIAVGRLSFRGKTSGVETEVPAGWVLKFRDGRLLSLRVFRDPEAAFDALGREQ